MKTFREWLREAELNESVKNIDLKKYIKNGDFPQDKFRKEIDKDLSKIFKDYYSSEEDIKKTIKSDMFLVTAHQLKHNKSIVEDRVYLCNTSPIGIANYKGDIMLTELVSGKKIKFELGNGINDRLQLLDEEMPVSVFYEIKPSQRIPDKSSRIVIGNIYIEGKNGKLNDISFRKQTVDIGIFILIDDEIEYYNKDINDAIKSAIEDVKYK